MAASGVRMRNVVFTQFNDPIEFYEHWETCDLPACVEYIVYQLEKCPETERTHVQGYVEFNAAMRMSSIANMWGFGGAHFEARKGSSDQAAAYCKKADSRIQEPIERGVRKAQGRRSDLERVAGALKEGASLQAVADNDPVQMIRYHRGLKVLWDFYNEPKMRKAPKVYFYWGTPGTGKSLIAHARWPLGFTAAETKEAWLDGYRQEECIIFDDFKGVFPYGLMLKLLDRYPLRLPIKGGFVAIKARVFVFTMNEHPKIFYGGEPAWLRRIEDFGEVYGEEEYAAEATELKNKLMDEEAREEAAAASGPDEEEDE